jgi:arylsulfatase
MARWSALLVGVSWLVFGSSSGAAEARPNIILILADDLGCSDLGCYGGEIRTPHLDRLGAGGLRFTHFYNAARCCPTRASLLTGLYPHQAGVGHMTEDRGKAGYRGELNRRCVTLAELLRGAGYRTRMAGKWHLTPLSKRKEGWPLQRGFEKFYGLIGSVRSYFDPPTLTLDNKPIRAPEKGYYLTDAITERAVDYLAECARKRGPFFLYVAYTAPHWPLHARPADVARYRGKYRVGWDAVRRARHRRMVKMGLVERRWALATRDREVPAWSAVRHKDWQARRMEVYASLVERMDRGIGQILAQLQKSGQADNTLVLFLSDNGGCAEEIPAEWRGKMFPLKTRDGRKTRVGNDPAVLPGPDDTFQSYGRGWAQASNTPFRRYKHWVHEGGIATPLIARWPARIKKAGLTHQAGHVIDVVPTCLDAAGVKYPARYKGHKITPVEGKSLLPAFAGKAVAREALFWEHEGNRAVRAGKWKLVAEHGKGWELYDLEADRTETTDLASKHPKRVREMAELYRRWARRCGVLPWAELGVKP